MQIVQPEPETMQEINNSSYTNLRWSKLKMQLMFGI